MSRKKTTEQFKKELKEVNPNIEVLGEYQSNRKPIKAKCLLHGVVWEPVTSSLLRGSGCNMCKRERITGRPIGNTDEFIKKFLKDTYGGRFIFVRRIDELKVEVECVTCGKHYKPDIAKIKRGKLNCRHCNPPKHKLGKQADRRYTTEQFIKLLHERVGIDYDLVEGEQYVNKRTNIKVIHNTCGEVSDNPAGYFLSGAGCKRCASRKSAQINGISSRIPESVFLNRVEERFPGEYEIKGKFKGTMKDILVHHNVCNRDMYIQARRLIYGNGCKWCVGNDYSAEKMLNRYCKEHSINIITQVYAEGLKDSTSLSYDAEVLDKDILIECQGEQHYDNVEYFGGFPKFVTQLKHDKIKLKFANKHGMLLLEIPYWVSKDYKDFSNYLDKELLPLISKEY